MDQETLKQECLTIQKEFKEKTSGYIVAGLGLVAGLAWNEAIKSLIEFFFPLGQNSIILKFVYAVAVTAVVVVLSTYISKITSKNC